MARDRQVIFQDIRLPRKSSCKRHAHNKKQRNRCSSQCLLRNGNGNTCPRSIFSANAYRKRKDSKCASSRAYIFSFNLNCSIIFGTHSTSRTICPTDSRSCIRSSCSPWHIRRSDTLPGVLRQRDTRRGNSFILSGNSYNPKGRFKKCR